MSNNSNNLKRRVKIVINLKKRKFILSGRGRARERRGGW
jgi:hypothetical protein